VSEMVRTVLKYG